MSTVTAVGTPVDWPKNSQKYDIYTNEEGMYELLLSSQQPEAKDFRRNCCNVLFPHVRQQLTNKMKEDHQQAIEEIQGKHQQAIEEEDAIIALMNDDLQDRDNQIQAIKYENVALQARKDVYEDQLQRCQGTITHLRTRYVPHARNPGKNNIISIICKHTKPANNKYHNWSYYIARIQRCKSNVKLRWFDRHFPDHKVVLEIDSPNSSHAFNRLEEEGHAEWKYNHFRLIDLTREELYVMEVSAILDDDKE